jgi:cellulose synthase/poly-beta-1,6-N-acetylglucosamine synthase-like glycosyltransferase
MTEFGQLSAAIALAALAAIAVIWLAYPLAVGIAARLRRRPVPHEPATDTTVTVVFATRESSEVIHARVSDLCETTWPLDSLEIVVAYDYRHAPPDMLAMPAGARLVTVPGDEPGGKAAALNAGVRAATGHVVVFSDAHQRYAPGTIRALVRATLAPGVGAATGSYRLAAGAGPLVSLYWRFERWLRGTEARLHSSVGATGAVYAIRRPLWRPLPADLILDDVYTPMQIVLGGHRVVTADDALAFETRTPTPMQEYGRKVRTLTGVIQLCAWLPQVLLPIRNPIWLQFAFHKLFRLLTPYLLILAGGGTLAAVVSLAGLRWTIVAALVAALPGTWLSVTRWPPGQRIRQLVHEAVLLQVAIVRAGVNGVRGHWRVWDA